jgi:pimeloyl-ACP methyl ester carboxylesterase
MRTALRIAGGVLTVLVLLLVGGYAFRVIQEARNLARYPAPGTLVDVGGRNLHLRCRGDAPGPTVIIETGSGSPSILFWGVQDGAAEAARVCTYDRAGYGWSDRAPPGRTMEDRVSDLHTLLRNARVAAPYVMVGHSYGGLLIRLFARRYPNEVAGFVFVDAADEVGLTPQWEAEMRQLMPIARSLQIAGRFGLMPILVRVLPIESPPALPPEAVVAMRADVAAQTVDEGESLLLVPPTMRVPGAFGTLGDLPVVVISRGRAAPGSAPDREAEWQEEQQRLLALSTDSVHVVAADSGHNIEYFEPELIVDAIRRVHAAARDREPLKTQ